MRNIMKMADTERFKLYCATYLILIKENKILLLRRFNTGWEDGKYTLISGHLERGETVKQAMIREVEEETGVKINGEDLKVVHTMHRKSDDREYIDFFLTADKWNGEPKIAEPDKCDEMKWFYLNNLPQNLLPHIRKAIESFQHNISFSEVGWD